MMGHVITSVNGTSIDELVPLDVADELGQFLRTIDDEKVSDAMDSYLNGIAAGLLHVGFSSADTTLWCELIADRAMFVCVSGRPTIPPRRVH